MTLPSSSLTGTTETTDCPRDPANVSVKDVPAAALEKGPTTRLPICRRSLWARVTPSSVYTLMPSTPAIFAAASGARLEHRAGVWAAYGGDDPRRLRERSGGGEGTVPRVQHRGAPGLHHERHDRGGDEQDHDGQLEEEHLAGHAARAQEGGKALRPPGRPSLGGWGVLPALWAVP